jgi:hypothetical protein
MQTRLFSTTFKIVAGHALVLGLFMLSSCRKNYLETYQQFIFENSSVDTFLVEYKHKEVQVTKVLWPGTTPNPQPTLHVPNVTMSPGNMPAWTKTEFDNCYEYVRIYKLSNNYTDTSAVFMDAKKFELFGYHISDDDILGDVIRTHVFTYFLKAWKP